MVKKDYGRNQDYVPTAENWQSVLSKSEATENLINNNIHPTESRIRELQHKQKYPCCDEYKMATIQDKQIYVALTDNQFKQLLQNDPITADGGLSGYFTDQATIDSCINNEGKLDNAKLNEMLQIAPHMGKNGEITYKPHVVCLEKNDEAFQNIYNHTDFNAAIAKCLENNHFGSGGGNQGFNPHMQEIIANRCYEPNLSRGFSDRDYSTEKFNQNQIINSKVEQERYDSFMKRANVKANDCIENNTAHPSESVKDLGFKKNENPIQTPTGNATEWKKGQDSTTQKSSNGSVQNPNISAAEMRPRPAQNNNYNVNEGNVVLRGQNEAPKDNADLSGMKNRNDDITGIKPGNMKDNGMKV